jgi:hypothetical protein
VRKKERWGWRQSEKAEALLPSTTLWKSQDLGPGEEETRQLSLLKEKAFQDGSISLPNPQDLKSSKARTGKTQELESSPLLSLD